MHKIIPGALIDTVGGGKQPVTKVRQNPNQVIDATSGQTILDFSEYGQPEWFLKLLV